MDIGLVPLAITMILKCIKCLIYFCGILHRITYEKETFYREGNKVVSTGIHNVTVSWSIILVPRNNCFDRILEYSAKVSITTPAVRQQLLIWGYYHTGCVFSTNSSQNVMPLSYSMNSCFWNQGMEVGMLLSLLHLLTP